MKVIIETDLGHDPDDFLAICWLVGAEIDVQAIVITPGDLDQIATARLICKELGLSIPIGAANPDSKKFSSGSIHHEMLDHYGLSRESKPDDYGYKVIESIWHKDSHLFVIGPLSNVGKYLKHGGKPFVTATMQGGFVPYSLYRPEFILEKFEGREWMPTFNLNGDRKGAQNFFQALMPRQMVGKNVCHTIELTKELFFGFGIPKNRAQELYLEACSRYLKYHDSKKLHDPTAAVCMLHPEIGLWMDGNTVKRESGWTTVLGNDKILVDIDRKRLWDYLSFRV